MNKQIIIEELRAIADDFKTWMRGQRKGYYDSQFLFWLLVKCRVRWEYSRNRPYPAALLLFALALLFYLLK